MTGFMQSKAFRRVACGTAAGVVAAALMAATVPDARAEAAVFKTPEDAAKAFAAAIAGEGDGGLLKLFGPEHEAELIGGDPAEARLTVLTLRRAVAEGMRVADDGVGRKELVLGRNNWPMPIPLVETKGGWMFDVSAGIEEITDRRIGRNELSAIAACAAYMDAQAVYASMDRDGDEVLEYAQKLTSTPGQHDGLSWEETAGGEPSPLGPFLAQSEQYLELRADGEPFHGYYFRILTGQGENPPGGKYDYVINGNMIAGYGLLAWPAEYGVSGIMTFMCSHHGKILQADLGEDTAKTAAAITAYDPDSQWQPVE